MVDQPVLCGPGAPSGVPDADRVRWPGDQVAVVVAETEAQAAAALPLIQVEWEDLPMVVDVEAARRPDAPLLRAQRHIGSRHTGRGQLQGMRRGRARRVAGHRPGQDGGRAAFGR